MSVSYYIVVVLFKNGMWQKFYIDQQLYRKELIVATVVLRILILHYCILC